MDENEHAREMRKQQRLEKLQTNDPICGMCGEDDWRCFEAHHVAGRKFDPVTVLACYNCHRKVSDDQFGHPAFDPDADTMLLAIGRFLLGLADMLRIIVGKLVEFGTALVNRAKPTAMGAEL